MTAQVLYWSIFAAHLMLATAMILSAWRMLAGPRAQDRILGLDTFYVNALLFVVVFALRAGSMAYLEAALAIALLGFAATVALAKFLMRGEVIE